ncbi:copper homeostasis protein CutC [Cypionkella sinensis]|uniref:PF03932 family protein CutC n=1 Tax=Cypionkella sinensis TaxID=1756043 RepID=A0ABV7J3W6_9RHOB
MADILLEVCVDDPAGLAEAIAGGADRIELCAALALGGLTPSHGLMQMAAQSGALCYPIIRPRSGDFSYTVAEVEVMRADIRAARSFGLKGVVLGASHPDGRLNEAVLRVLLDEAAGLDTTLHRCIDLTPDKIEAVQIAKDLGFRRILTSGGALTAAEGAAALAAMIKVAGPDLIIMPGSGVSVETLPKLCHLPLREIHASCASPLPSGGAALAFGFQSGSEKRTNRAKVAALKAALAGGVRG